jgi:hypothetical protein
MPRQLPGKNAPQLFVEEGSQPLLNDPHQLSRSVIATLSVGLGPDDVGIDQVTD